MIESKMPDKRGMKCLSFQQPYAMMIAAGIKTVECRSRKIKTPIRDLVVCASKTAKIFQPIDGLAYGYAIGLIDVVDCLPFQKKHLNSAMMTQMPDDGSNAWILENPRMIVPYPVKASASFFYTDFEPDIIDTNRNSYEKNILPVAYNSGDQEMEEGILYCLFEDQGSLWDLFEL